MNFELMVTIGDIAETIRGVTYEKADARNSPREGYSPLIRATNIDHGALVLDSFVYVPDGVIRDDQRLRVGDIVLAASSGSLSVVGKAALLRSHWSGTFGAFCYAVRPHPECVVPDYLAYFMQTSTYRNRVSELAAGVNINNLRREHIESVDLPYCALAEQRRIVDAIDSYLTRLDAAVASLERAQAKLKAYRASVLKAAVEGRLVPTEASFARVERRSYEPAEAMLARILKERRRRWEGAELARLKANGKTPKDDKWKTKYEEPVAPDTSRLPELPDGWCWASLDQLLAEPLANGKSVPDGTGVPVLRLTCINNGFVDLTERKSGDWTDIDPQKFLVEADDFLVIRGNGSIHLVGRGGRVSAAPDGVAYPDTLIRARVDPAALYPPLLPRWWDSPPVRQHIERRAKTTAGIYKVNQADLGQTPVAIAPMLEQIRIHDDLERIDTTAIAAMGTIAAGVRRCSRLRQAVLKWAFEGRLVDQDSNDEPADELLVRIRAERAIVALAKKSRGRTARGTA